MIPRIATVLLATFVLWGCVIYTEQTLHNEVAAFVWLFCEAVIGLSGCVWVAAYDERRNA